MRVLHEERHALVRLARGHAGIVIRRPGIRVVAAGKGQAVLAIHVEGIFHDVVALDADGMDEERAGEVLEAETFAYFRAVDGEGRAGAGQRLAPFGELFALFAEEAEPEFRVVRAVQAPVVRARDAGVDAVGAVRALLLAQQREVGREVQRVEIVRLVGQHVVWQADVVERRDARAVREDMGDGRQRLLRVEGEDEHRFRAAVLHRIHGLRVVAEESAAEVFDALNEITGYIETREIVIGVEIADGAGGIVDRDRARLGEVLDQRVALRRGQRVAERLEERRTAGIVAGPPAMREIGILERLDLQRHAFTLRVSQ